MSIYKKTCRLFNVCGMVLFVVASMQPLSQHNFEVIKVRSNRVSYLITVSVRSAVASHKRLFHTIHIQTYIRKLRLRNPSEVLLHEGAHVIPVHALELFMRAAV
jgi:hypothetical protein